MGAVTFPEPKVAEYIVKNIIPVRVAYDHKPLAEQFQVKWTPTLVTLDTGGKEHHRTVGFLPAEELIPSLLLGEAKIHFDHEEYDAALKSLEAIFLRGVSRYKSTQDPKPLREAYETLQAQYPQSEWTKRALPYRLIP